MSASRRRVRALACVAALTGLFAGAAAEAQQAVQMDPANPTCPLNPNWSNSPRMTFRVMERPGQRPVLLAEGMVDADLMPRLRAALETFQGDEIWLRSSGGDARIGNQAGTLIRQSGLFTRIPEGWACFSACNFLFMGGRARYVDPGGLFIVHMFTFTNNRDAIRQAREAGDTSTVGLIGDIEQQSAQLASEDNDFLIRMGLYRTLLTEIMYSQRAVPDGENQSTRRCLTQEEVRRYNVVNTGGRPPAR